MSECETEKGCVDNIMTDLSKKVTIGDALPDHMPAPCLIHPSHVGMTS